MILVLDTLRAHQTAAVRQRIQDHAIQVLFIPGGLTGLLQPLDVGINGPLKHWLRESNAAESPDPQTSPEQRRIQLVNRLLECWNRMDTEMVMNSFNHTVIRTAEEVDDFDEIE